MKKFYSIKKAGVLAILLAALTLSTGAAAAGRLNSPELGRTKFVLPQEDREEHDFVEWRDVTVSESGQLEEIIKDDLYEIDSLVVRGPVNADDFTTMWKGTFYGRLSAINLKNAEVADGEVPYRAFFDGNKQVDPDADYISVCRLRNLILPEGVTRICEDAFEYAVNLQSIELPSTLRAIDEVAFYSCINLDLNPCILPDSLQTIGDKAFFGCKKISEVVLPHGLRKNGEWAFNGTMLSSVSFPDRSDSADSAPLEIGSDAFSGTCSEEVIITRPCTYSGERQFWACNFLRRATLPEGLDVIPNEIFAHSHELEEVNIPSTVRTIENGAFASTGIVIPTLPEGLERIGNGAFRRTQFAETLVIPSSVKELGDDCFAADGRPSAIYCMSAVPPVCGPRGSANSPFGRVSNSGTHALSDVPLHVPVGCGDAYREAGGWYTFRNIIEDPDIHVSGIIGVTAGSAADSDAPVYDLTGRRVDTPQTGRIYIVKGRKVLF